MTASVVMAHAQATESRISIMPKAGVVIERGEDNLRGSAAGGGVAVGIPWRDRWSFEIEMWLPQFLTSGAPEFGIKHRDFLANVAVVRHFGAGRVRPFVLIGLGVATTQDRFNTCTAIRPRFDTGEPVSAVVSCTDPDVLTRHEERFDGTGVVFHTGIGTQISLTRRVSVVPDLRINGGVGSILARPSIGLQIAF